MFDAEAGTARQWGDFQTPAALALEVCQYLAAAGCRPGVIVEPTCGEGHFIRAAAECFPGFRHMYGLEIQPQYVAAARAALAHGPDAGRVAIHQGDIFTHRFPDLITGNTADELLVLGNPPWVTNAELSTLDSANLPVKGNFKGHAGLDAMTGKSNFDISESIIMKLLQTFGRQKGHLALLVKNAVIRNLIRDLPRRPFPIADIKAYGIDARKHFGASVDASLLFLRLGADVPSAQCTVFESMASDHPLSTFGWCGEKFVADVEGYERLHHLDGQSPYVWRQGLKHDCARVMELTGADGRYTNSLGETVELEPESVYPLLKSSDLKGAAAGSARFVVPVPQHKIGEDTAWVAQQFPRLWAYLERHQSLFRARKSAIYKGQPRYAMFGIGEYSFAPYKVAVSGLYKRGTFTLIGPQNGRPVMLDDTCYFLGFDGYEEALRVCTVLNSEPVQRFLQSVVFLDAKRPYTKELLMRIDLSRAEATR